MMQFSKESPFLVKLSLALFSVIAIGFIVYIGQDVIIPFAFAVILAILLLPLNRYFENKGASRVTATFISLILFSIVFGGIIYFLFTQIAEFADDIPTMKRVMNRHLLTIQRWIQENFNLSRREQKEYIEQGTSQIQEGKGGFIGQTLISFTNLIAIVILLPIYTFLILYYRDMIRQFLVEVFKSDHQDKVIEVIQESRVIVYNYMLGISIEMGIITVINTVGFLIIGIKYAFFLGFLAAILNMIPYIGMLIASVICMLVTLTTSTNISDVLWVLVVLSVVQFFDNNIIMPRVVGSKVKINALMTIFGAIVAGALCGFSGMFLSIPIVAIIKVIFDRIDELKPWGRVMGDEISYTGKNRIYKRIVSLNEKRKINRPA
jgi:predicted PurR-regulated permease PerM